MKCCQKILICLLLLPVLACPGKGKEQVKIRVGSAEFLVEIADSEKERAQGLMYRSELGAKEGMLFVFDDEARRNFWMKNTLIPLSIAYISASGTVNEIHDMRPQSLDDVASKLPAMYALELNRGAFEKFGVSVGDKLALPINDN